MGWVASQNNALSDILSARLATRIASSRLIRLRINQRPSIPAWLRPAAYLCSTSARNSAAKPSSARSWPSSTIPLLNGERVWFGFELCGFEWLVTLFPRELSLLVEFRISAILHHACYRRIGHSCASCWGLGLSRDRPARVVEGNVRQPYNAASQIAAPLLMFLCSSGFAHAIQVSIRFPHVCGWWCAPGGRTSG